MFSLFQKPKSPPAPTHIVPEPPLDPSKISTHKIDFESLGIPEYKHRHAIVIDHLFTPEDCQNLYSLTGGSMSDSFSGNWEVAQVDAGNDKKFIDSSYRNSGRMLIDTPETAEWILARIKPYLEEITLLRDTSRHFVPISEEKTARARLVCLNERLRFLKYIPGNFFKRHCDGLMRLPSRKLSSYYTLQLYLNGSPSTITGGATRIFSPKDARDSDLNAPLQGPCVDVPPRTGRVLIFEQQNLLHSGEPIEEGVKISIRTDLLYEIVHVMDAEED